MLAGSGHKHSLPDRGRDSAGPRSAKSQGRSAGRRCSPAQLPSAALCSQRQGQSFLPRGTGRRAPARQQGWQQSRSEQTPEQDLLRPDSSSAGGKQLETPICVGNKDAERSQGFGMKVGQRTRDLQEVCALSDPGKGVASSPEQALSPVLQSHGRPFPLSCAV